MGSIFDNFELTHRAISFLETSSSVRPYSYPRDAPDVRREADALYGAVRAEQYMQTLASLQGLGGLSYFSHSWSFQEEVTFWPEVDLDPDDGFPAISLIEHSVAHPFGVWADESGAVKYMFPGEHGGCYVTVFPSVTHVIESDALHAQCAGWSLVSSGGSDSVAETLEMCEQWHLIPYASGYTEWWWDSGDERVHVWRTYAEVFQDRDAVRWARWKPKGMAAGNHTEADPLT